MLARLLIDPRTTRATLGRALRAYDAIRRPFSQRVQAASRENGLLYTLNYPGLTFDGGPAHTGARADAEKLERIRARIQGNWEWAWETTVDADLQRALRMLDEPPDDGGMRRGAR